MSFEFTDVESKAEKSHEVSRSFDPDKTVDSVRTDGISEDRSFDPDKPIDSPDVDKGGYDKCNDIAPNEIGENNTLQPNSVYEVDGEKHYTDDNGDVYRINNDLAANNTYEINGYKYKTDKNSRIISAEGKLQIKDHEGRHDIKDTKADIGKGDEKATDDRGHIIGDQFNGSNGMENIVAQDSALNQREYKDFENQLAKEVNSGKDVHMRVDLNYPGDSHRPGSFLVSYSINGEEFVKVFSNDPRGEVK